MQRAYSLRQLRLSTQSGTSSRRLPFFCHIYRHVCRHLDMLFCEWCCFTVQTRAVKAGRRRWRRHTSVSLCAMMVNLACMRAFAISAWAVAARWRRCTRAHLLHSAATAARRAPQPMRLSSIEKVTGVPGEDAERNEICDRLSRNDLSACSDSRLAQTTATTDSRPSWRLRA